MFQFRILLFATAALCCVTLARAEGNYCAAHDTLADILNTKFGEQKLGMGLAGRAAMVELFVSAKGSFTLVTTNTAGVACIVGAGDSWEKAEPKEILSGL